MKNKPKINLNDEDFGCILTCAVRYSLGRQTYMPKLVYDFIRPLLPYLTNKTLVNIRNSIQDYGSYGYSYGADFDLRMWMEFKNQVEIEIEQREAEGVNNANSRSNG